MADQAGAAIMYGTEIVEEAEDARAAAEPSLPVGRQGKRRRVILIGIAALLVVSVAGGAAYLLWPSSHEEAGAEKPAGAASSATFVDAPPMLINVHGADGRAHFLKLRFVIVASDEGKADELKDKMPVIVDSLQSFLRELRPEDLSGSVAVYRIKEEMMVRMRRAFGAGAIEDVLIQDLVEQ